jgi:hypothetical protein
MFVPAFVEPVRQLLKLQTVRQTPKHPPQPGDLISCRRWVGVPYRPGSRKEEIASGTIYDVADISIYGDSIWLRHRRLTKTQCQGFAKDDGFSSFTDLTKYFRTTYSLPFHGKSSWMAKKYGTLTGDWQSEIKKGFSECFRVLKSGAVLIFKWNELDVPVSQILKLTPIKPLLGNRSGKNSKSHWIIFMKP